MEAKHTPGPWRLLHTRIDDAWGYQLCHGDLHGKSEERNAANLRLIAAAPDMLQALRRAALALAFAAESSPAMQDDYNAVSAAIAKATGSAT